MKQTIGDIPHTLNLIHYPISRQREEGEGRMDEVESKLHLFGCQQRDLYFLLPKCAQNSKVHALLDQTVSNTLVIQ